jgi:hypothetical protein
VTTSTLSLGGFSFSPTVPRWTWTDGMFALHGMAPGDVVPTRALLLSHVHPEDRDRVAELLDTVDGEPHGCAYRLVDLTGNLRHVLIALSPAQGEVRSGLLVDDSDRRREEVSAEVNSELEVALESHAAIDQAKGMLMLVYGVDSDAAFELLRWASQQRNVRLRVLADRLVKAVHSVGGVGPKSRAAVDELFVAAMDDVTLPDRPPRARTLEIQLDQHSVCPLLRVRGHVDVTSMGELAAALNNLMVAGRDARRAVVDLSGVEDAGAVVRFVVQAAQRRSAARDVALEIIGAGRTASPVGGSRASSASHGRQSLANHA